MALIVLEGLSFSHAGGPEVLKGLDLRLEKGERFGLLGPNGSGKTTLFHVIMGLLTPTSGRIEILGRERRTDRDFREVRRRVGLLFQDADDQLFSPTVLDDVAFGPLNQGKKPGEARAIACEALRSLGLDGFEDRVPHKLSAGEKKLVALATVLAMKTDALLLDEPSSGLDPETTDRIAQMIAEIDAGIVMISHDMDFLSRTTDRIRAMKNGRIMEADGVAHTHAHAHSGGDSAHSHPNGAERRERPEDTKP